jgi:hypothetical protein
MVGHNPLPKLGFATLADLRPPRKGEVTLCGAVFANPPALVREISEQGSMAKLRPDQRVVFIRDWGGGRLS